MTRTLKGFMNLENVEIRRVPYTESKRFGRGTDAETLRKVEQQVARALLTERRPLRGTEVMFFRSVLGMSQKQLGARLGYSDVAILKWERNKTRRLEPVNEVALRALMAELFEVKLQGTFQALLGDENASAKLVLDFEGSKQKDVA
jgi:DNA-binding transcriptional regulator YiaG